MTRLHKAGRFIGWNGIAGNSVSVTDGRLLGKVWGFVVPATDSTGEIIGIAAGEQSFDDDNQTVAKAKIQYIAADDHARYDIEITGGALTQADEGGLYDLDANGIVDGSATGTQVRLEEFISATRGIFSAVR